MQPINQQDQSIDLVVTIEQVAMNKAVAEMSGGAVCCIIENSHTFRGLLGLDGLVPHNW